MEYKLQLHKIEQDDSSQPKEILKICFGHFSYQIS